MVRKDFKLHVSSRSCLVVASGPSAQMANSLNTYGHVATLNRTLSSVEGLVDYAIFQDVETLEPVLSHLHRCSYLIVPEQLHEKGGGKLGTRWHLDEIRWLPDTVRLLVYPHRIPRLEDLAKEIHERRVPFYSGGCIALFVIASLGFKELFCLGFDGGYANFDGSNNFSYERFHDRDKLVALHVAREFDVGIHFWDKGTGEFVEQQR